MIEETARILSVKGKYAEVETQRQSSCGSCAAKAGCGTAGLAALLGKRRTSIRVLNPIAARPGEDVIVGIDESAFTKASMAVYLTPLGGLLLGAFFGQMAGVALGLSNAEPLSIIAGLLGLGAGLLWIRGFFGRPGQQRRYQAVILRRVLGKKL